MRSILHFNTTFNFQFCMELQGYGYHSVAYGFYGGFSEIAYTTICSLCAAPDSIHIWSY